MKKRILFAVLALPTLAGLAWAQIRPSGKVTAQPGQVIRYETVRYETEIFSLNRAIEQAPYGILYPGMSPFEIRSRNFQQRQLGLERIEGTIRNRGRDGWRLHSLNKLSEDGGYDQIMLIFEQGRPMP